jgi:hypothetical protein
MRRQRATATLAAHIIFPHTICIYPRTPHLICPSPLLKARRHLCRLVRSFRGRVVDGFSIGCPTGKEKECGGRWLHKGIITEQTLSSRSFVADSGDACDGHGTHTASIAAGTICASQPRLSPPLASPLLALPAHLASPPCIFLCARPAL